MHSAKRCLSAAQSPSCPSAGTDCCPSLIGFRALRRGTSPDTGPSARCCYKCPVRPDALRVLLEIFERLVVFVVIEVLKARAYRRIGSGRCEACREQEQGCLCGRRNDWIGVVHQFFEGLLHTGISRIAHCDRDIAQEALVLRAPHRRTAKQRAKLFFAQRREFRQFRCRSTWAETIFGRDSGSPVPGANLLADIASK